MSGPTERWHRHWLRKHLPLISELKKSTAELDIQRAGRILDWIGVAGGMSHSERVKWLAIELACKQGYTLDQGEALADRAAGPDTVTIVVGARP